MTNPEDVKKLEADYLANEFRARLREMPCYWVEVATTPKRRTAPAYFAADVERALEAAQLATSARVRRESTPSALTPEHSS